MADFAREVRSAMMKYETLVRATLLMGWWKTQRDLRVFSGATRFKLKPNNR